jgi:PDZ domain
MKRNLFGLLALVLSACAPVATNFSASNLEQEPIVKVDISIQTTLPQMKTFYILPYENIVDASRPISIAAEHLAFQTRNYMELLGYDFVSEKKDADIEVVVSSSNEYSETYIPPTQYSVPSYVPAQTARVNTNTSGNFTYNGVGSGYGNYSGNTTGTITLPGYYTSSTYTAPGRTVGFYYPSIYIGIYNTKDSKKQASIYGVGTSKNPDIRVAIQGLLYRGFTQLPISSFEKPVKQGKIGINYAIWTADGNTYYPIIIGVEDGFPAQKAGLQSGDFILSIDGNSLRNLTASRVDDLISAEAGVTKTLLVNRGRDTLTIKLTWVTRS